MTLANKMWMPALLSITIVILGVKVDRAVVEHINEQSVINQTAAFKATSESLTIQTQELVRPHLKFPETMRGWAPQMQLTGDFMNVSGEVTETLKTGDPSVSAYSVIFLNTGEKWVPVHVEVNGEVFLHTLPK